MVYYLDPGCGENEVGCNDKSRCIISQWVCDSHSDCADGSDESPNDCKLIIHRHKQHFILRPV